MRRLKYFACVIELIQKSRFAPTSKKNPNKSKEMLHRFYGLTADNELFCIQIKEDVKNKQKFLISVFPTDGPWDWDMWTKKDLPLCVVYKPQAEGPFYE